MPESMFTSIIANGTVTGITFLEATACSLLIGLFIAFVYSKRNRCSDSLAVTLVLLPAIVQVVIMMVNGNIGAGVATAGAFSLVRFRSAAGKGQEITGIFLAMAAGLATGMGYLAIAVLLTVILMSVYLVLSIACAGRNQERILKISVPENLDYEGVFDDIFEEYASRADLVQVRTAEMGSIYKLQYRISLKNAVSLKQFMDEIRMRNGNLEVSCGRVIEDPDEL